MRDLKLSGVCLASASTFCTTCLRAGLDVRTVVQLMGHKDIESTLRYWRPVEMEQLRGKMGAIFQ
jgi:site-specific recombinase XerD